MSEFFSYQILNDLRNKQYQAVSQAMYVNWKNWKYYQGLWDATAPAPKPNSDSQISAFFSATAQRGL